MTPLNYLQQDDRAPWIEHIDRTEFAALIERYQQLIGPLLPGAIVVLAEPDPIKFLAAWIVAASNPCRLVLCNPDWQNSEWAQLNRMLQADLWIGDRRDRANSTLPNSTLPNSTLPNLALPKDQLPEQSILIPTGGTSGQLKFAIHTWETLSAAVFGFQAYFDLDAINCCCVLPLYHVSGLMQALRSLISGGTITIHPWKAIMAQKFPRVPNRYFISLVPTQLVKLLNQSSEQDQAHDQTVEFLQSFTAILLGGAPSWPHLLAVADRYDLPIALTYGMTETAGQVATLKPEDFRTNFRTNDDATNCGYVLPHASIAIDTTIDTTEDLAATPIGPIQITARSQMLGYFPPNDYPNISDDVGYFDRQGQLHVVGRLSSKIITGGENVYPSEVEAAIRATGLVSDVYVYGIADPVWGEAIVAAIVPADFANTADFTNTAERQTTLEIQLATQLAAQLAAYKCPKHWQHYSILPRNAQGKLSTNLIKKS
jgi:o-succinylbenzoate---CoA ligase